MRNEQERKDRRDAFAYWWPFGLQIIGATVGVLHFLISTAQHDQADPVVIGFASFAITAGGARNAQERWNSIRRSSRNPEPEEASALNEGQVP